MTPSSAQALRTCLRDTAGFHARVLLLVWGLALTGTACSSQAAVTEPEGGYQAFVDALLSGNPDTLWPTLSEETHRLFDESLQSLHVMRGLLVQLDPADRDEATRLTGIELLQSAHRPEDLFRTFYAAENIPDTVQQIKGLRAQRIELVEEGIALVTTRADQRIELVRERDGVWRVREPLLEVFENRLSLVHHNRANVELAVSLFGSDERARRDRARVFGDEAPADPP